ncbi:hypothetical protein AVEN_233203-1 [Araneus ventricosus]|uniref:Uncharacterized protein n=1 Tax=Araneus ventricosus TaxID=182803 RepID=A0A4Y2W079_ARAVE|nr:hypothetical protein AVEN_233203-1 [Araneus ventricosus]
MYAQNCRKAIRDIQINGGNETLTTSRNNEQLNYEKRIAASEDALIYIGPYPVMNCVKHHEPTTDVEVVEKGQYVGPVHSTPSPIFK